MMLPTTSRISAVNKAGRYPSAMSRTFVTPNSVTSAVITKMTKNA